MIETVDDDNRQKARRDGQRDKDMKRWSGDHVECPPPSHPSRKENMAKSGVRSVKERREMSY